MTRVVIVVVALVLLLLAAAWGLQRRLIYLPSDDAVPPAAEMLPGASDVDLRTSDGLRLGAWYLPATEPDLGVTVLVANGNAGDRGSRAPLARALAEQGLSVLLFDYRGYGGNPGDPTEDGLGLDVRAAREFLVDEQGVPPDQLIYYGESLGTGVVVGLATDEPPAGLVLRSPFVDLAALGSFHYPYVPVRLLLRDDFPLRDQIRSIEVPVTVVYGTADSVVPAEQSRDVADAVPGPLHVVEVEGADHNDAVLLDGKALVDAVVDLAERIR
ncbi:MAG: alpha/beta fold hydrolase [Propionibacteriales bacterium]|nr:alpha/beta fold hydrolase [Propionibacteriales bacterium]